MGHNLVHNTHHPYIFMTKSVVEPLVDQLPLYRTTNPHPRNRILQDRTLGPRR